MSERALVIGGAGFLGSHLCDRLVQAGTEVECVDSFITGSADHVAHLLGDARFTLTRHDITTPYVPAEPPDIVYNMASPASPRAYLANPIHTLKVGTLGTLHALGIARSTGARFFLASTSEVYGDPELTPQPETYRGNVSTTGPRAVYDEAKRVAEAMTLAYRREHGVSTTIARIFNTFGPRLLPGDGRVIANFITQALAAAPLTVYGDGSQSRSFCYVDDLVDGILALSSTGEEMPVNLGHPEERTILQTAEAVIAVTGSGSSIEYRPLPEDDPKQRRPDIARARALLGWDPRVTFEEGLARTAEWHRRNRERAVDGAV